MNENKNKRELTDQDLEQAIGAAGDAGDAAQDRTGDAVEDRTFDHPDTKIQKASGEPYRPIN